MPNKNNDVQPKYLQLARMLRERILSKEIEVDQQMPSESELCEQYGVSRGTVRDALEVLVQEGLVYKVMGKGAFVGHPLLARGKNSRRGKDSFALIVAHVKHIYALNILRGVEKVLRTHGFHLVVKTTENRFENEIAILEDLKGKVNGFIILVSEQSTDYRHISNLCLEGDNVVLIFRDIPRSGLNYVGSDFYSGARQLTGHLAEHGCDTIYHLSLSQEHISPVRDKMAGWKAELKSRGLPVSERLVVKCPIRLDDPGEVHEPEVERFWPYFEKIADGPGTRRGVVAVNYMLALNLADYLLKRGVSVPDDVAIVTFGENEEYRPGLPVSLTRIQHPINVIGERAARRAIEAYLDPDSPAERIYLADKLILGNSCGLHEQIEAETLSSTIGG